MSGRAAWKWHLGRCDDRSYTLVRGNLTKSKVGDYYIWKEESLDLTSAVNDSAGLCYWPAGTPVYRSEPSSDVSGSICWCEIGGSFESKASKVCKLFDGIGGQCIELQPMHIEVIRPAVAWLPNKAMVAIVSFTDAANGGRTDIFSMNELTSCWTATSHKLTPDKYKSDVSLVANEKYLYAVNAKVSKIDLECLTSKTKKRGWRTVAEVPLARIWSGVILIDERYIVVIGGVDRERTLRDDLVVFDTKNRRWCCPKIRLSHGRINPSVVFCESSDCLVVLGGYCEVEGAAVPATSVEVIRLADVLSPSGKPNQTRLACVMPNNRPQPLKALQPIFGQCRRSSQTRDKGTGEVAAIPSSLGDCDSEEERRSAKKKTTLFQSIMQRWHRSNSSSTDSSRVTTASSTSSTEFFPSSDTLGNFVLESFDRQLPALPEEDWICSEEKGDLTENAREVPDTKIFQISSPSPPASDDHQDYPSLRIGDEDSKCTQQEPFDITSYKWPTASTYTGNDVMAFYNITPRIDHF